MPPGGRRYILFLFAVYFRSRGRLRYSDLFTEEELSMNNLHLICNAHLDPVWLWEWEEGAAEAISTFRCAADFCEEFSGFVFNHNEVTLYRWVEEYEPALFARIQRLVGEGKWHIMGGWYLQPDCNMPSGESFVRQILMGNAYFMEKFGVKPTTAINFDPFGHNRGLVQILAKSGYDSYLFCRPFQNDCPLPSDDFTWVGFDGSRITAHRASMFYNQPMGKAREKIENWIKANPGKAVGIMLWGVGNHGGGPSREDLNILAQFQKECTAFNLIHSTPEDYFRELRASDTPLPAHENDINPWGPGCYTSQIRIKQKHRLLENTLYQTEKMLTAAKMNGLLEYPREDIEEAVRDLLVAEFHDILPGSSIQPVEDAGIRLMDHALEILSRIRARAFFALASGQPKASEGEIPILVYNPHPYPIHAVIEAEFQLPDAKWEDQFTAPTVYQNGVPVPTQVEKEMGNLNLDWRKRPVFYAQLEPSQINRFDCRLEVLPERPKPMLTPQNGRIAFKSGHVEAVVNCQTGLIDQYSVDGVNYLKNDAFKLLVIQDNEDPWETRYQSFRNVAGEFTLMSPEESTEFSGVTQAALEAVRVIEDGPVRTVVEALFRYHDSFAIIHYKLPKLTTELEIGLRVHWNEKSKMLKLSIPTLLEDPQYFGQVAYGTQQFPTTGREIPAQKWTALANDAQAVTCINNSTYGSDSADGEMRLSLLRSPSYAGHPIGERPIVLQDRYTERIDQGERLYKFWVNAGARSQRLQRIDTDALIHNETPFPLSFYPHGAGKKPMPPVIISDDSVQMTALKKAQNSRDYILRVFNPTDLQRTFNLEIPPLQIQIAISINPYEIKTLSIDALSASVRETDLMERC
jgi:alpha-mannosidase